MYVVGQQPPSVLESNNLIGDNVPIGPQPASISITDKASASGRATILHWLRASSKRKMKILIKPSMSAAPYSAPLLLRACKWMPRICLTHSIRERRYSLLLIISTGAASSHALHHSAINNEDWSQHGPSHVFIRLVRTPERILQRIRAEPTEDHSVSDRPPQTDSTNGSSNSSGLARMTRPLFSFKRPATLSKLGNWLTDVSVTQHWELFRKNSVKFMFAYALLHGVYRKVK